MYKTRYWLLTSLLLLLLMACDRHPTRLVIGYIKPSVDHLPLTWALSTNPKSIEAYDMVSFTSGWEVQEALAAGKLDVAILPFTYAWTLRSKGHRVKTLACLERETDGIITPVTLTKISELNDASIGLLRASSLEALMDDFAAQNRIKYQPVYFRTPSELMAALTQGKVDAAVSYVPVIQKMPDDLHVLHWFSEYYPGHPCCDLVATEQSLHTRQGMIRKLLATLQSGIYDVESAAPAALSFMADYYLLSPKQTAAALEHVRYRTEITAQDKAFERKMMQAFVTKGYVKTLPTDQEMYYRFQE